MGHKFPTGWRRPAVEYDEVTTALIVLPKETKKEDFLNGRQK